MAPWAGVFMQIAVERQLKRTLQLLEGSPCPCWNSTKPSSRHSSPPANWRTLHCSRTAPTMSRIHLPGSGNPCREPCSTTLFSELTSPPASLRNRRRNCMDLQASLARSAEAEASASAAASASVEAAVEESGEASEAVLLGGNPCGECGSTRPSCLPPKYSLNRLHNCKGQQDLQAWLVGLAVVWAVVWAAA